MRSCKTLIGLILLNYVVFGGFLFLFQDFFLYHPTPYVPHQNVLEQDLQIDGEILKLLVVNPGHDRGVLYFGGNAESVGYNAPYLEAALPGQTLYLINYRGYGGSTGTPSEAVLYGDALRIYDEVSPRHRELAVIGRSLGSGVATYLAVNREISRMVLVTPFDSIENVAQKKFPFLPIDWILSDSYHSMARVGEINIPVMILVAENDRIVESWSSDNLIAAFSARRPEVYVLADSDHNSISQKPEYYALISRFLSGKTDK